MRQVSDFTINTHPHLHDFITVYDAVTRRFYPMKSVATPSSRFSNARWLRTTHKAAKNFNPTIVIEPGSGDVLYYAWENTLHIPSNLEYARYMWYTEKRLLTLSVVFFFLMISC